jgi:hypothetical protein
MVGSSLVKQDSSLVLKIVHQKAIATPVHTIGNLDFDSGG